MSEDTKATKTTTKKAVKKATENTDNKVIGSGTTSGKSKTKKVSAVGSVADGVIGSSTQTVVVEEKKETVQPVVKETVAVYSSKNVSWDGVGHVKRGYNILPKDVAEKWITIRSHHARLATPEEVAKEFGV